MNLLLVHGLDRFISRPPSISRRARRFVEVEKVKLSCWHVRWRPRLLLQPLIVGFLGRRVALLFVTGENLVENELRLIGRRLVFRRAGMLETKLKSILLVRFGSLLAFMLTLL